MVSRCEVEFRATERLPSSSSFNLDQPVHVAMERIGDRGKPQKRGEGRGVALQGWVRGTRAGRREKSRDEEGDGKNLERGGEGRKAGPHGWPQVQKSKLNFSSAKAALCWWATNPPKFNWQFPKYCSVFPKFLCIHLAFTWSCFTWGSFWDPVFPRGWEFPCDCVQLKWRQCNPDH